MESDTTETQAMLRHIQELVEQYCRYYPKIEKTMAIHLKEVTSLERMVNQTVLNMPLHYTKKQIILEALELKNQYEILADILFNEIEIAKIRTELTDKLKGRVEKNQKEYLLREQLHYIRQELGEENAFSDADQFEKELIKIKASKEVKERIKKK